LTSNEAINNLQNKISVFPNPFTNELNIQLDNVTTDMNFELFDLLSNKINENQLQATDSKNIVYLKTQNLSKGIYILKAANNKGEIIYQRKVVCMNHY